DRRAVDRAAAHRMGTPSGPVGRVPRQDQASEGETMSSTTTRSVTHDTFTLERRYDATPARVFAAFADQEAKQQWFGGGDGWGSDRWYLDFRVGGREVNHSHMEGGPAITFESTFQ